MTTSNTRWRKSSYSGGNANACVELDRRPGHTGIRDSKAPDEGRLVIEDQAFGAFLKAVQTGHLNG